MKPARTGPLSSYLGTSITRLNSSQDQTQNFCKLQCHLHTQTCEQKKISGEKLQAETKDAHTDPERVARIQIPGERLRKTMEEKEKKLDHGKGAHTLSRDAGSSAEAGRILAATWARGARSVRVRGARKRRGGSSGAQAKMGSGRGRGAN